jgi:type I restriction enzyme S subunit
MKNGFVPAPIGSVCRLVNGRAFKPGDWSEDGIPIVRIQNLNGPEKPFNYFRGRPNPKHLIGDGDVLLSWSGTPGTSFGCFIWNRGQGVLNQHIFKVHVCEDKVDKEYFVYAVNSVLDEMIAQAHGGVGLRHITKGKLEALNVPVHRDLREQRRIVERVKAMMERANQIRQIRRVALEELRSLETAVFADFIEANRKEPSRTVELGKILSFVQYGTSQKAAPDGRGVPMLRMGNIQNGALDTSDVKCVQVTAQELQKYRLNDGDILFNRTNSMELVGKAATFEGMTGDWVFASYLVRLVVDPAKAVPEYITAVINSRIGREFILRNANRAIGMVNINAKKIQGLPVPLPSLKTQKDLVEQLQTARSVTAALYFQMDTNAIEALPQAILRKAFAGEL